MDERAILVVTATLFAWGLVSRRLERADLSAPIVFTLVGGLVAALGLEDVEAAGDRQASGGDHACVGPLL